MVFDYGSPTALDIGVLTMDGGESWQPLLQTEANEAAPALSPDGAWIAYTSDQTGQSEIYVRRFPDLGDRQLVSSAGGMEPLWSPDGSELFYREGQRMMSVSIDSEVGLRPTPEVVFEGTYLPPLPGFRDYDVAPDGRFLMVKAGDETGEGAPAPEIAVVLNWFEELTARVPVP